MVHLKPQSKQIQKLFNLELLYFIKFITLLFCNANCLVSDIQIKPYYKIKTKYLASYLIGFNPPVTLMNTSTSVNKVTFTQTRAHKYLSVRTQMVDIFLRSLLYGISLQQFLHGDKEMECCSWHSGLGGPLCLPCWGEDCFVIETHIHMLYK